MCTTVLSPLHDNVVHINKVCSCLFPPPVNKVKDAQGQTQYLVRPDTCCGGCCVMCVCKGGAGKCCAIPFKIRDHETKQTLEGAGGGEAEVVKLWSGMAKECCGRNNYSIRYVDMR